MPSNKQYTEEAIKLAEELGLEVKTEGLNNQKLADLVSDLKAKKKDAERETSADKAEDDAAAAAALAEFESGETEEEEEAKKFPFYVKEGKAVTSKRGILSDGDEIKADDLPGGKEALDAFVKSGHVAKS